jgi:hypothetical protein
LNIKTKQSEITKKGLFILLFEITFKNTSWILFALLLFASYEIYHDSTLAALPLYLAVGHLLYIALRTILIVFSKSNRIIYRKSFFEIDEHYIAEYLEDGGIFKTSFENITHVIRTSKYYMLFFSTTSFFLLPVHTFFSQNDFRLFEAILKSKTLRVKVHTRRYLIWVLLFLLTVPFSYLAPHKVHVEPDEIVTKTEEEKVNAEAVFYAQPLLLEQEKASLLEQRDGIADIYFVGFAGSSSEDVFMKEVVYVQKLFDRRFDSKGRSLVLINNRKTQSKHPIASLTNLSRILHYIGKTIEPQEDILFLLLTSHGRRKPELSVSFSPLVLNDIDPETLRKVLHDSGIKWKIIVISSCYSGGFINALKDDYSLIITSTSADRLSFGCSNESDMTNFSKAFFKVHLNEVLSFITAFNKSKETIRVWEQDEESKASQPQISGSRLMFRKLKEFEEQLKKREKKIVAKR